MAENLAEILDNNAHNCVDDITYQLSLVRAGRHVPVLPNFLSRECLPQDRDQRSAAIVTYAAALSPGIEPEQTLARQVLTGAMMATVCQINDVKIHNDCPSDATPDYVLGFLIPMLTLLRPAPVSEDPLWRHLREVILHLPRYDSAVAITKRFELLKTASAPTRRRAILAAIDAINLVAPPEYERTPYGGTHADPTYNLVKQSFETPYRLDDGPYLTENFFKHFAVEQSAVAACLSLMATPPNSHSDDP